MYVKLFASLYQGTLRGRSHAILVFTNLLANADQYGHVDKHWAAIAGEVGLTVDDVKIAVHELEAPDPESRTQAEEGRRIVPLDEHRAWGWRIVNYGKYREIRNAEDRREQNRVAQEKFRNKNNPLSATVSQGKPQSAHAEAEAEAEAKGEVEVKAAKKQTLPAPQSDATEKNVATWKAYKSAYLQRYLVEPVRNASVNSKIKQFVARLGDDAPHVAMHYVRSHSAFYVRDKHGVGCMLKDAEGLHTEWATGRTVTHAEAQMADETQARGNVWSRVAEKMDAKERVIHEQVG